jgi:putative nucleotidyltransferase with HDIG domain
MANSRLRYRAGQFWHAVTAPREGVETRALQPYLSPAQIVLFRRLQPFEQIHALQVLNRLKEAGLDDPDLLTAALLHDIGKILSPLSIWERVEIVLSQRLFPRAVQEWGNGQARGLRHPFVVAEHHPAWGAGLAAQAGASAQVVSLINRHHDALVQPPASATDRLLAALQHADDPDGEHL